MSKLTILFIISTTLLLGSCSVRTVSYSPGYSSFSTSYIGYRPTYWGYRTRYSPRYRYRYGSRYNRWGYSRTRVSFGRSYYRGYRGYGGRGFRRW